jgi:DNA-binding beta-propeller fold protein YncE
MRNGPIRQPLPPSVYRRRRIVVTLAVLTAVFVAVFAFGSGGHAVSSGGHPVKEGNRSTAAAGGRPSLGRSGPKGGVTSDPAEVALPPLAPGAPAFLAPGSDPSVLPGPILIADKLNNRLIIVDPQGHIRWTWPRPGDLAPGQTFLIPDDAFFSPDGRYIIATEEDDYVVTVIDIATRKIVWRYGHPGVSGSGPGYLWNPDDAMVLRDGTVIMADIKNCRLIEIPRGGTAVSWQEGTLGSCTHNPPNQFGSPNGIFPLSNGHFLVTEINGDWVDEVDLSGHVFWTAHPPAVSYPSDSNQVGPDSYLTVDYSSPGQVVLFDRAGQTIWRYAPTSAPAALNHPSLGEGLPNGDILLNDDADHRVIVINPTTNQIVWQYGHDGVPGSAPGYLDNPDGLDPLPPYSYADRFQAG